MGQIAKNLGCYVIGFAGTDHKVKWLKEVLKFDAAYNYKTKDVNAALLESAPHGVDCYFDNVSFGVKSLFIKLLVTTTVHLFFLSIYQSLLYNIHTYYYVLTI